jgi:hypothetical protein
VGVQGAWGKLFVLEEIWERHNIFASYRERPNLDKSRSCSLGHRETLIQASFTAYPQFQACNETPERSHAWLSYRWHCVTAVRFLGQASQRKSARASRSISSRAQILSSAIAVLSSN